MASQEQRVRLIEALSNGHQRLYHESADFHAFVNCLADGLMTLVDGAVEGAVMQQIRIAAAVKAAEAGPVRTNPLGWPPPPAEAMEKHT